LNISSLGFFKLSFTGTRIYGILYNLILHVFVVVVEIGLLVDVVEIEVIVEVEVIVDGAFEIIDVVDSSVEIVVIVEVIVVVVSSKILGDVSKILVVVKLI